MTEETRELKLRVLSAISQIVAKALDLEQTLRDILRILSDTLSMKRATVTLFDPTNERLIISASHGLTEEEKQRGIYRLDEGVTGKIFRSNMPYYVPDIRKEPLFLNKTGSRGIEKTKLAFLGVPISLHGKPLGVLNVDRLFGDEVSVDEDIEFLNVVATLIAQFISLNEQVQTLRQENASLKYKVSKNADGLYIVGKSPAMLEVQRQIEKVAPTKATVLLLGESGTGKTLIARILHELSDRRSHPFIKVNCASIPENLLESELFGYEKGAFTGATGSKPGKFEEADKGTLFLDEIGELGMGLQAKLLRVLQEKEFERLGSNVTRKVDVRILAATNRDLGQLVRAASFRPDLYYRLNVFPVQTPPLRERKEDIVSLLSFFLNKVGKEYGRRMRFTPQALEILANYDWPGNVREMENLVERLVILAEQERIDAPLIIPYIDSNVEHECLPAPEQADNDFARPSSLKELEKSQVLAALQRNDWIQSRAARDLGITPRQMGYRIAKYNLEIQVAEEKARSRSRKN